ncbi:MAG: DMT family transporter [Oscillospiraceae bacterium]|nr:DMT family transporter [Oscillospiraceae bacterium]
MKHNNVRQILFPILAALIWGTAFVAQDLCADVIDTFSFNAARSYIAVVVLLVIIFIFDKLKKDKVELTPAEKKKARRDLLIGGFCCGTALAVASNFQQAGIAAGTEAGKAGFLTALYVVLVPLFGLFFRRKVSLPVWIAVVLSVVSLYLLCIKGDFSLAMGDLLVLVCAVCFAIHILVIDHFTATVDGIKLSCVQFFFAAVWATLAKLVCTLLGLGGIGDTSVATSIFAVPDWAGIWACILPILYVGVFSSGVAYTLQILAQKGSNPTVVTILLSLESVFAVIAGAIILQQQMTGREYLGCVLMMIAVILAQIPNPFEKKAKA